MLPRTSRGSIRTFALFSAFVTATAAFGQFPGTTTPPPSDLQKGWDSITIPQAKDILTFLATQCDGRGSGQPGYQKAADFVAAHFKAWGLKPMGDKGTYFQQVPFIVTKFDDGGSSIDVIGADKSIPGGAAFRVSGLSASMTATGVLAVVHDGATPAELADASLKGRVVLVYADKPANAFRTAILRQAPAAVLFVSATVPPATASATRAPSGATATTNAVQRRPGRAPSGFISTKAAAQLLAALDMGDANIEPNAAAPVRYSKGFVRLKATIDVKRVGVPNVVAMLPGSDPTLKDEYIGIGGHLDHLGKQGTVIYPGADDDGSGATAVQLIAHAMVLNPKKPRRNILFMTFCGEELGLVGSTWLVNHPMVPLNKMVAELQMDMVARDSYGAQNGDTSRMDVESENKDTIRLVGSKRISTELDKDIQEVNKSVGFRFRYDAEDVYTRSDHYNFASHGIPISFLFDGFTPDYHQPGDTVDKINFLKLTNAAKLYYLTAFAVSERTEPPVHDVHG